MRGAIKRAATLGCLALVLAGCVSYEVDDHGNPVSRENEGLEDKLVIDDSGRFLGVATRLSPPHTIVVNGGKPTEREIRLLGVEGLSESEAPNTYRLCQEWMSKFLSHGELLYIKPQEGADLSDRVIYGEVFLDADSGDGYVSVNMAMLSKGLVRIRDIREFDDAQWRQRMQDVENAARREKLGLWSNNP